MSGINRNSVLRVVNGGGCFPAPPVSLNLNDVSAEIFERITKLVERIQAENLTKERNAPPFIPFTHFELDGHLIYSSLAADDEKIGPEVNELALLIRSEALDRGRKGPQTPGMHP